MKNVNKYIKSNPEVVILVVLVIIYFAYTYYQDNKTQVKDTLENITSGIYEYLDNTPSLQGNAPAPASTTTASTTLQPVLPTPQSLQKVNIEKVESYNMDNTVQTSKELESEYVQSDSSTIIANKPRLEADDLLPKYDDANEFAKQNPVTDLLKEQNFLIGGYHTGINTVMQANKIPYHDLRSAPPIAKETVGPWSQSSYEVPAGTGRRMLEIL